MNKQKAIKTMIPSVLLLLKNEEYFLPFVLKQLEGHFENYVIYDINSSDQTPKIIDWWYERNKSKADIFIRKLPHCEPSVQGALRNAMIAEGKQDIYLILDGDEIYRPQDIIKIPVAADKLRIEHWCDTTKRYGVVQRVEVNKDLTLKYLEKRTHHRLYTRDTYWTGTHPGERAGYAQNEKSEIHFDDITCLHLHNTWRSPREADATHRLRRKTQRSYHPGNKLEDLNLLDEFPILQNPIENFKVSPALAKLQERRKLKC